MGRKKTDKQAEETPAGAPDWMVTFSDCMTLLLTFFVLMLSFASFKPYALEGIGSSLARAMPSAGLSFMDRREAMSEQPRIARTERIDKGADVPTPNVEKDNLMKERRPLDFRNLKVFTVPSEGFFLGQGEVVSQQGRVVLDKLADFLVAQRSRVVVSENGLPGPDEMGLRRASAVVEYLSAKQHLDSSSFSITASSMVRQKRPAGRMLEITLLEKDVYE